MWLVTAIVAVRGPHLSPIYLIPVVCLAAIGFVLAYATQERPATSQSVMVATAAAAGLALGALAPEPSSAAWILSLVLAGIGAGAASLLGSRLSHWTRDPSSRLDRRSIAHLLRLGWWIACAYALGWGAQVLFGLPLILNAALAAFGITLFLGLSALVGARLQDGLRPARLSAELGLYFCALNLALLLYWVCTQRLAIVATA